jgi:hypothetical protein
MYVTLPSPNARINAHTCAIHRAIHRSRLTYRPNHVAIEQLTIIKGQRPRADSTSARHELVPPALAIFTTMPKSKGFESFSINHANSAPNPALSHSTSMESSTSPSLSRSSTFAKTIPLQDKIIHVVRSPMEGIKLKNLQWVIHGSEEHVPRTRHCPADYSCGICESRPRRWARGGSKCDKSISMLWMKWSF